MLYGRKPDLSYLKTFGCLGYATNVGPQKGKFEPRAHRCVFIGYSPGQKAYKMYSLDSKKILISRAVIFYENSFPYHDNTEQEVSSLPLPLIYDMDCAASEINEHDDIPNTSVQHNEPPE